MAVNWTWKHKFGTITFIQEGSRERFDVNVYSGTNCLCALIYDYVEKETKKEMYVFHGFFGDVLHLKRCLGLQKNYDNLYKDKIAKVKLNLYYEECIVLAKYFAKAGFKVEIYYKEIK